MEKLPTKEQEHFAKLIGEAKMDDAQVLVKMHVKDSDQIVLSAIGEQISEYRTAVQEVMKTA